MRRIYGGSINKNGLNLAVKIFGLEAAGLSHLRLIVAQESGFYYLQSRYYDPSIGRFINADAAEYSEMAAYSLADTNLFAYCGNNPVCRDDADGNAFDTVFDVVSLASSLVEVIANPADPWAWAGLVGDVLDVAIPFVSGLGEVVDALKVTSKAVKGVDEAIDTYKNVRKVTKGTTKEAHHIIEKRFASSLGIKNTNNMLSIALPKAEHRKYTNAWRAALPYGKKYTKPQIFRAAMTVYAGKPRLLGAALYTIFRSK